MRPEQLLGGVGAWVLEVPLSESELQADVYRAPAPGAHSTGEGAESCPAESWGREAASPSPASQWKHRPFTRKTPARLLDVPAPVNARACMRACACVCVRACVRACACVYVCVHVGVGAVTACLAKLTLTLPHQGPQLSLGVTPPPWLRHCNLKYRQNGGLQLPWSRTITPSASDQHHCLGSTETKLPSENEEASNRPPPPVSRGSGAEGFTGVFLEA